jgi:exonuclease V
MKDGSKIHKNLEEQVHAIVPVDVQTKEDGWGLRIWNVIQGLRTLRDTGQTRELEIWGTIDGLVVNGIIDELSYVCPDKGLEDSLKKPDKNDPPPDQPTIAEYFKAAGAEAATQKKLWSQSNKIYICDVKTRSVHSLPSEMAFRPTRMQLLLYHSLLSALVTNNVDFSILTERYKLDPGKVFSDSFIAQVGSLNDEQFYDAPSASQTPAGSQDSIISWSQDSMTTLLAHNTLSSLWSLMISEFQTTLPNGALSLGNILKAEYRSRDTGEIVGSKTFAMDELALKAYVEKEMRWWRGEREAQGVVVEEAFKCRSCEFAEGCEWRLKKVEEAKEKVRMTRKRTAAI